MNANNDEPLALASTIRLRRAILAENLLKEGLKGSELRSRLAVGLLEQWPNERSLIGQTCPDLNSVLEPEQIPHQKQPPKPDTLEVEEEEQFNQLLGQYQSATTNFGEFRALAIKPRTALLGKWMKEGDTGFVYGVRGHGKSWLVDMIVSHLTTGKNIDEDWNVPAAVPVLFVDGEMPWDDTCARLGGLAADKDRLYLLHHEILFERTGLVMNLANPILQRVVTAICEQLGAKLLVLDTLPSLFRGIGEDKADEWEKVLPWLLDLRRRRIAQLIVQQAGRSGEHMRGTSRREDDAFWIIHVKETDRAPEDKGARFETRFTKWRNIDSVPLLRQWVIQTEPDGTVSHQVVELSFDEKVLDAIRSGFDSATAIAEELRGRQGQRQPGRNPVV
jgi:hypothetical protein